jgi:hypothetical protein
MENILSEIIIIYNNEQKRYIFLVWFEVLTAVVMKSPVFWDVTLCSLLKANRRFGGICRLKMETTCSYETSVGFQRTTLLYIPACRALVCSLFKFGAEWRTEPCMSAVIPCDPSPHTEIDVVPLQGMMLWNVREDSGKYLCCVWKVEKLSVVVYLMCTEIT